MRTIMTGMFAVLIAGTPTARAESVSFEGDAAGAAPTGWVCGSTGGGAPRWTVENETVTPDARKVLQQSGSAPFPWCVKQGTSFADGVVEVRFKPLAGREDQAGGIVWRWKDGDTYYVCRANALENNVSLYYTEGGRRRTIKYVDAPVAGNAWHTLRAEFKGTHVKILLDGKAYIELDDGHISGAGSVGVWTKADSVTIFDAFAYQGAP
jgi:hypothetical protein